jgi:hypothetical protein
MQQVPFMMDTERLPRMGFEPNGLHFTVESANEFHDQITSRVSEAKAMLFKAKDEFKLYYDHWRIPAQEIRVGDQIWVNMSEIQMTCPSAKFSDKQLSPFKVVKVVRKGVYKLELPPSIPSYIW